MSDLNLIHHMDCITGRGLYYQKVDLDYLCTSKNSTHYFNGSLVIGPYGQIESWQGGIYAQGS